MSTDFEPESIRHNGDKINQALLRKWLAALREGKYQQTRCNLWRRTSQNKHDVDQYHYGPPKEAGFCCLGVLAHVANFSFYECEEDNELMWLKHDPDGEIDYDNLGNGDLPNSVREDLGLTTETCDVLMGLNDGRWAEGKWHNKPWTFKEIANFLEEELLEKNV